MSIAERSTALGLRTIRQVSGSDALDRLGLRRPAERWLHRGTAASVRTAGTASRAFSAGSRGGRAARPTTARRGGLFDLTPDDEQQMLQEASRELASGSFRPAGSAADAACAAPPEVLARAEELELRLLGVSEEAGGAVTERSAVTATLVAEALAHGDAGLAVAALGPASVATALGLWGDADQQGRYLGAITGEQPPVAALAVQEEQPLFDPARLRTVARREGGDLVLSGVKALVGRVAEAELLLVAVDLRDDRPTGTRGEGSASGNGPGGGPALVLVESGTPGVSVEAQPAMGLRAAATGRLRLDDVRVPERNLLAGGSPAVYAEAVHRSRVALAAVATGVAQAVVDYVIPYVNDREAFGEPVSHRQGVAFTVSDLAIETDGLRLATWRAASLADQGADGLGRAAAIARRLAAEKGPRIGSDGVQMLGGHGYVKEHPVERWYRDLRALGVLEGVLLV